MCIDVLKSSKYCFNLGDFIFIRQCVLCVFVVNYSKVIKVISIYEELYIVLNSVCNSIESIRVTFYLHSSM